MTFIFWLSIAKVEHLFEKLLLNNPYVYIRSPKIAASKNFLHLKLTKITLDNHLLLANGFSISRQTNSCDID